MRRELLLLIVLVMCGCEAAGPETDTPEPPLLHPQASTIPQQNAIRIEWDPNAEENLVGYRVYRSTSSEESFQVIAEVSERDDHYEDTDVSTGIRYYYRVSAINDIGNESDMSDSVSYALLEKPTLIEPADHDMVETTTPAFTWLDVSGASSYTVHVQGHTADGGEWEELWKSARVYPYQDLRRIYNDDGLALKPLERGMTYRWRVDSSGGQSAGSQSRWQHFAVTSNQ